MFCHTCWRLLQTGTNTVFNPVPPRQSDVCVDRNVACFSSLYCSKDTPQEHLLRLKSLQHVCCWSKDMKRSTWRRSFLSSSIYLCVCSCSCFCSSFTGTLIFTRSFLLQNKLWENNVLDLLYLETKFFPFNKICRIWYIKEIIHHFLPIDC
jgi:hypothetical protein